MKVNQALPSLPSPAGPCLPSGELWLVPLSCPRELSLCTSNSSDSREIPQLCNQKHLVVVWPCGYRVFVIPTPTSWKQMVGSDTVTGEGKRQENQSHMLWQRSQESHPSAYSDAHLCVRLAVETHVQRTLFPVWGAHGSIRHRPSIIQSFIKHAWQASSGLRTAPAEAKGGHG